jgi:membrane-associated HD superfamily phosphohydrolase
MSSTEAASRPRELINSDRMLLAVLSVLLLSHAGLYYVCLRFNLPFAFAFAWPVASFVLDLQLPESIASAIIENFFMLVVGEFHRASNLEVTKLAIMRSTAGGVLFRRSRRSRLLL